MTNYTLAVVQTIVPEQSAGSIAPGSDGELACELGFRAGREHSYLFVAHFDPLDVFIATYGLRDRVGLMHIASRID